MGNPPTDESQPAACTSPPDPPNRPPDPCEKAKTGRPRLSFRTRPLTSQEQFVLTALYTTEWRNRSNVAIAKHFNCSQKLVKRLRDEFNIAPKEVVIELEGGKTRIINVQRIGRRGGTRKPQFTPQQQDLMAQVVDKAIALSQKYANNLLDETELFSIAQSAIVLSCRYFNPEHPKASWKFYAIRGIRTAFRRAFHAARKRLRRERLFSEPNLNSYERSGDDQNETVSATCKVKSVEGVASPEEDPSLLTRLVELPPPQRLVIEWMIGYGSTRPRSLKRIAGFLNRPIDVVEQLVQDAKTLMEDD